MGATSGIGQEVARLLAANGYEVGMQDDARSDWCRWHKPHQAS